MELFFGGTMLFWIALALLATLVPLRLFAEELRSGTIEPLLTAPVAMAEAVLGKWLAAFGFYLTAWTPTLLYLVYLRAVGSATDPGVSAQVAPCRRCGAAISCRISLTTMVWPAFMTFRAIGPPILPKPINPMRIRHLRYYDRRSHVRDRRWFPRPVSHASSFNGMLRVEERN